MAQYSFLFNFYVCQPQTGIEFCWPQFLNNSSVQLSLCRTYHLSIWTDQKTILRLHHQEWFNMTCTFLALSEYFEIIVGFIDSQQQKQGRSTERKTQSGARQTVLLRACMYVPRASEDSGAGQGFLFHSRPQWIQLLGRYHAKPSLKDRTHTCALVWTPTNLHTKCHWGRAGRFGFVWGWGRIQYSVFLWGLMLWDWL